MSIEIVYVMEDTVKYTSTLITFRQTIPQKFANPRTHFLWDCLQCVPCEREWRSTAPVCGSPKECPYLNVQE